METISKQALIKDFYTDSQGMTLEKYINSRGYSFYRSRPNSIINLDYLRETARKEYIDECKQLGLPIEFIKQF